MLFSVALALSLQSAPTPCSSGACIFGTVAFTDSATAADYRVRWVTGAADARVRFVTGPARRPGEWQVTSDFADYTLYEVGPDDFADFTAMQVDTFPGCQ